MGIALLISLTFIAVFVTHKCVFLYQPHLFILERFQFQLISFGEYSFLKFSNGLQIGNILITEELRNSSNEPVPGFFAALRPSLLILDPEIIRDHQRFSSILSSWKNEEIYPPLEIYYF